MKIFKISVGLLVLVWIISLGISKILLPVQNPEGHYDGVILDAESDKILQKSCFDCHSHLTRSYWYMKMPVVSIIIAHHISEGREELNFSNWNFLSDKQKKKAIEKSIDEIVEGEMPIQPYVKMHPEVQITQEQLELLKKSALKMYGIIPEDGITPAE